MDCTHVIDAPCQVTALGTAAHGAHAVWEPRDKICQAIDYAQSDIAEGVGKRL